MRRLDELPTPVAVVDLDRLDANLRRMQDYADQHGLRLRPHAKTHKATWVARRQVELGAAGLTVATPVEAAALAPVAPETLVAFPAIGPRGDRLARVIAASDRTFLVGLDSVAAVDALRSALRAAEVQRPVGVLVELDLGMRRVGVASAEAAAAVAGACDGDELVYRGLMFYPGHIRQRVADQGSHMERLARDLERVVDVLGEAGLEPGIVSGGSTPAAFRSHEVPTQTEIRPGTYVYNDRTTLAIGACARDDCAYTVLATVISSAVPGQAVVDAGSKALSSDVLRSDASGGYGELLDRPEVVVSRMSEEHGILDLSRSDWRPAVGERVRIIPNHVCVSVNLQPRVIGIRGGEVEKEWEVEARGWWR